jgi:hypothetical protein
MTASDTASSSDTARSVSFSGTGWPVADPEPSRQGASRDEARARIYRQLWQPPGRRARPRQALGRPYVWDGNAAGLPARGNRSAEPIAANDTLTANGSQTANGTPSANGSQTANGTPSANGTRTANGTGPGDRATTTYADRQAGFDRRAAADCVDALTGAPVLTERAVIGDELRLPTAWCQIGACIARYTDGDALGEADVRARAVASGWCADLFGRLVCPSCQQIYAVWSARPVLPRDELAVPDDRPAVAHRRGGWAVSGAGFQFGRHRRTYGAGGYGASAGIY